jgi:heat shock protein HslJ
MSLRVFWLIALFQMVCGWVNAGGSAEINLDNISFISSWTRSGKAKLINGEYREPAASGSTTEIVVKLTHHIAFGKLDGKEVAAVILVTDPGGSGTFYDLALLIKEPEGWINQEAAFLGERVKIHSLAITNDAIIIDITTQGPGDAMCCPTKKMVQEFILNEGRLIKTSEKLEREPEQALIGTVWKWRQTLYPDDTRVVPANSENYTLKFLSDGKINVRADCNLGGGSYTLRGNEISIEITYTTRAACPPGSLEQNYIRDLNAAVVYFFKADVLYFNLKYGVGTMKFMN